MRVFAIDPGNIESAYCVIDAKTLRPLKFGKVENEALLGMVRDFALPGEAPELAVIERIASYGMAVGRDVFETCEWLGRFAEAAIEREVPVAYVYRRDEKLHICGDPRAKDANIRRALIDRFAMHDMKNGKGTKQKPDWFYGITADVWAAYAVGLTYIETQGVRG